jgi:transposase-like protein
MKRYFVYIFWFACPACNRSNHQKLYCRLHQKEQLAEAERRGVLSYKCHHCGRTMSAQMTTTRGDIIEVGEQEAVAKGLALDTQ